VALNKLADRTCSLSPLGHIKQKKGLQSSRQYCFLLLFLTPTRKMDLTPWSNVVMKENTNSIWKNNEKITDIIKHN